ncbi:MAG: STAS domain-containing protein [Planctomycetota bacterium]
MSELAISRRDLPEAGVSVIVLNGVLDGRSTAALEAEMRDLAERGRLKVVVDCAGLTHLSSDGMGIFLSHLIKIRKQGGDIKFCAMRQEVRAVLSVLGLGKLLVVSETEQEAVRSFGEATAPAPAAAEGEKLRVEVTEEAGVAVCSLFGFVDRHTIEQLDGVLDGLLEQGKSRIVIDCAELTYISSNGMGVFISYVSKARSLDGDIRLCNMRDIARTVITMLGLHRLFQVFDSRAAAIQSYR